MENQAIPDDLRSHVSHFSAVGGKVGKARSIADGQSHHSFSNHSQRGYLGSAFPSNLVNSRPELRQSRQSLAAASERMSRASYAGSIVHGGGGGGGGQAQSIASKRGGESRRPYSTAGSTHTLNNYCDTSDNWTDHDMDIYMARNATARNGGMRLPPPAAQDPASLLDLDPRRWCRCENEPDVLDENYHYYYQQQGLELLEEPPDIGEDEPPPDYESDEGGGAHGSSTLVVELSGHYDVAPVVGAGAEAGEGPREDLGATPMTTTSFVEWENYRNRLRENLQS
ncbi:hypothetical protein pipiens_006701 [Culex pipiens pipiens]|uniref:Uncharacterized protein n=1 Tax=Culex pipiens pipiens TaxID=38569 RepID=A0ABD1DP99_CULPP